MCPTTEKELAQLIEKQGYVRVYRTQGWAEDSADIVEVFRPELCESAKDCEDFYPIQVEQKSVWGGQAWSTLTTTDWYFRF
jgi:hypothetical protein